MTASHRLGILLSGRGSNFIAIARSHAERISRSGLVRQDVTIALIQTGETRIAQYTFPFRIPKILGTWPRSRRMRPFDCRHASCYIVAQKGI
jgi:hypothetical protein